MKAIIKKECINFLKWYNSLTPRDKVSVWSKTGEESGLFNLDEEDLVKRYFLITENEARPDKKPLLVERFADNGEHSHWDLINVDTGETLWTGNNN